MLKLKEEGRRYFGATAGAIVGDCFYIFTADHEEGSMNSLHILPITGDETRRIGPPIPTPRANIVATSVGQRIYAIAGILTSADGAPPSSTVEVFDTVKHQWQSCAPLPAPRVKPGLTAVGSVVYVLGGRENDLDASTIFAYEPESDRWAEVGRLPYGARHGAACTSQGLVYYGGGFTAGPAKVFHNEFMRFDPISGQITPLANMPAPRTAHELIASDDGGIYLVGGVDPQKAPTRTVFRYEIADDQWHECRPLGSARAVFACDMFESVIHVAGGWKRMGKEANSTEERYPI